MKVHTLGSVSLQSAEQVAEMIAIVNDEASFSPVIAVLSSLPGVADQLRATARGAAGGVMAAVYRSVGIECETYVSDVNSRGAVVLE